MTHPSQFSGAWRYWLFGLIPLRGIVYASTTERRKGPHIWRYLGVWRDAKSEEEANG